MVLVSRPKDAIGCPLAATSLMDGSETADRGPAGHRETSAPVSTRERFCVLASVTRKSFEPTAPTRCGREGRFLSEPRSHRVVGIAVPGGRTCHDRSISLKMSVQLTTVLTMCARILACVELGKDVAVP